MLGQPVLADVVAPEFECCSVAPRWTDEAVEAMYDACRRNSFLPGTAVLMADGSTKPIEDVEIGDWVWAHDPETGETGPRRVVATIVGDGQKQLVDIQVAGDTLTATGGHPFWVDDEGQWVDAGDLVVGDHLLLADGSTTVVAAVDDRVGLQRVHNLTVEGIHTYYVDFDGAHVLVHNSGCTNLADLPADARLIPDADEAFGHLDRFHGLSTDVASARLHDIKRTIGLPGDFDVLFGPTGDVWNPVSGDLLGNLVVG